jgi:hypothetical protein
MVQVIILADIWLNMAFLQLPTAVYSNIKSDRKNGFFVMLLKMWVLFILLFVNARHCVVNLMNLM